MAVWLRWLDRFTHLEDAGYITVALVGLRLLLSREIPLPAKWLMISAIAVFSSGDFLSELSQTLPLVLKRAEVKEQGTQGLPLEQGSPLRNSGVPSGGQGQKTGEAG